VVNLDLGYIQFTTNHFSSFMLKVAPQQVQVEDTPTDVVNTEPAPAKTSRGFFGGCTLGGDKNSFDPTFYLLLLVALMGMSRRKWLVY